MNNAIEMLKRIGRPFSLTRIVRYLDGTVEEQTIYIAGSEEHQVVKSYPAPFSVEQLSWYRGIRNAEEAGGGLPYAPAERELYFQIQDYERKHRICLGGG